jgi:hypothetical protein
MSSTFLWCLFSHGRYAGRTRSMRSSAARRAPIHCSEDKAKSASAAASIGVATTEESVNDHRTPVSSPFVREPTTRRQYGM